MLRTLLILAVALSLAAGCAPKREPYYPHRDRRDHRHYRTAGDTAKAVSPDEGKSGEESDEGGTPMPDVSDDKPAPPPTDDTSKQMLDVLKGIADKLDKQPQTIHHEFEQFAKMMDSEPAKVPAAPPAAKEPLEPIPQRAKSEATPEPVSKFQQTNEGGTLDTPYGDYTGIVVRMDLTGTSRVNGRLTGGRCVPCRQAWNMLADECTGGWTMGNGPQFNFWIKPATLRPGTTDPFWERVEHGRVMETKRGTKWIGNDPLTIFRWHPLWQKSQHGRPPRGLDPDFPPKAPGADGETSDWPDERRQPDQGRDARTPLQQFADWKAAGLDAYGSPEANGGKPLNFMGRALAVRPNGFVGVDEQWHSFGDEMAVATFATQAAASAAFARATGNYSTASCSAPASYASPSCSQPNSQGIPYELPLNSVQSFSSGITQYSYGSNCSQPANYGYQQSIPMQSYQPQWPQPMQSYGGGQTICGPWGCYNR